MVIWLLLNSVLNRIICGTVHLKMTVPQYNGHKITIEGPTHSSGLPEFPDNYCLIDPDKSQTNSRFNPISNRFDELYEKLYVQPILSRTF